MDICQIVLGLFFLGLPLMYSVFLSLSARILIDFDRLPGHTRFSEIMSSSAKSTFTRFNLLLGVNLTIFSVLLRYP